jgi:integrin alpha 8
MSDLAVGAPYDGPDQRGAVYIFLGSRDGIVKKPSQVSLTVSS